MNVELVVGNGNTVLGKFFSDLFDKVKVKCPVVLSLAPHAGCNVDGAL